MNYYRVISLNPLRFFNFKVTKIKLSKFIVKKSNA